nr:MAG TPA: hypothetical protein [Caudoviricetes sp.]
MVTNKKGELLTHLYLSCYDVNLTIKIHSTTVITTNHSITSITSN